MCWACKSCYSICASGPVLLLSQHFLPQRPRSTKFDLTDTAALEEVEGAIYITKVTPLRPKHHSTQGKSCLPGPQTTFCASLHLLPLRQVPNLPLASATTGSNALSWERQSYPSAENQSLPNRITYRTHEVIPWGDFWGKADLYLHYCSWSLLMRQWWLWNSKAAPGGTGLAG